MPCHQAHHHEETEILDTKQESPKVKLLPLHDWLFLRCFACKILPAHRARYIRQHVSLMIVGQE
jgi:hypothetical protein